MISITLMPDFGMLAELRPSPTLYEDWMLMVFILVFIHIAYVRIAYQRRLQRLFNGLMRLQMLRQVMREELVFSHRASVLLFFNFVMLGALVLYLSGKYLAWQMPYGEGLSSYLFFALLLALVYYGKLLFNRMLRWLFADSGLIREYLFEVFLVNKALGLFLIPLALGLAFVHIGAVQPVLMATIVLCGLMLLFRLIQGFRMSLSYRIPQVYIILYLCTLEILPLLVMLKALERVLV